MTRFLRDENISIEIPARHPWHAAYSVAFREECDAGFEFRRNQTKETEWRYVLALAKMGDIGSEGMRIRQQMEATRMADLDAARIEAAT